MNILPENVRLIEYLRCPTCKLTYYIDHPEPYVDNYCRAGWNNVGARVKGFKPLTKGGPKVRQDCDKRFAYDIKDKVPNLLRSANGTWHHVVPSTLKGVLGMIPCDIALSIKHNYGSITLNHPTPTKVRTAANLWKFASKHDKLKELEDSIGQDRFGELSGKVLVRSLKGGRKV